eukprot:4722628-Amphidinium_carterae.1
MADFGLAGFVPEGQNHLRVEVKSGTPGYCCPSFMQSGVVSEKSEVTRAQTSPRLFLKSWMPMSFSRLELFSTVPDFANMWIWPTNSCNEPRCSSNQNYCGT